MNTNEIAHLLEEIATLMELLGENAFKINAFRRGARQLEDLSEDLGSLIEEDRLDSVPGIGKALKEIIEALYHTGTVDVLEDLRKQVPEGLTEMLKIPGLGAKKISAIYNKLNITKINELKKACKAEKLSKLPGFGKKTEDKILDGIAHLEEYSKRKLWWDANETANTFLDSLRELEGVERAEVAGSVRRGKETIGDIDLLVASSDPVPIMKWFVSQSFTASVTSHGETKSSIRIKDGLQVDLRIVPNKQFPFAWHYFTGSKEHNIKMRSLAKTNGWTLNEYDLEGCKKEISSEEELFKAFGLAYIPAELREDHGEIEAAKTGTLPNLVNESDIRGVFHNHTRASDGQASLEEMAEKADEYGWEYLGLADHSKSSVQANGLSEERLFNQIEQIEKINKSGKFKVHLFSGVECDILQDGVLDFDQDVLKRLDYVVVSVHQGFQLDEKSMTDRIIKALENPMTTMLGHLTGRLLLKREPYAVNVDKVIDAAAANGKIIELNANPYRLDMDWRHWKKAKQKGVMCAINPDAHSTGQLDFYKAGVTVARKGWLEKKNILNTFSLNKVKRMLSNRSF